MTMTDRPASAAFVRYLALVAVLALPLALTPPTAVSADEHTTDHVCADVPEADYLDRDQARAAHRASIDCATHHEIVQGQPEGDGNRVYLPLDPVRRDQMATFVVQTLIAMGLSDELPPGDADDEGYEGDEYTDTAGNVHQTRINQITRAGIVRGYDDGTYRPRQLLTRDQMATFIVQAHDWAQEQLDGDRSGATGDWFADVSAANVHFDNVNAGYEAGLFVGVMPPTPGQENSGTYSPRTTVLRDQMATFMVNLLSPGPGPGDMHHLALLATTEVHAHLMPWDYYADERDEVIGLAKTHTLIEEAREQFDNTLLFDTGDILQGAFIGEFVAEIEPLEVGEVHPAVAAMNLMDYDALTLGNHEFDFGLDFLDQVLADAEFPAISANVYRVDDAGEMTEPYVDPYVVVETEVDGLPLRVGVLGITPPGIMQWHRDSLLGLVDTIPAIDAIERWLPVMQEEDLDLTLLSVHAGKRLELGPDAVINPQGENWLWFAAEQFQDELDAIVFGHEQSVFPGDAKYDGVEGLDNERGLIHGVPAVMAGAFGNHLGIVHLHLSHDDGAWSVVDGWAENVPVTEETEESPEVVEAVREHHQATIDYVRSPVGETEVPIAHFFSRVMDTTALELINRAQTWAGEDLLEGTEWEDLPVLSAAAPFRAGRVGPEEFTYIPPGEVTVRQIADLYIYPNRLYIVALNGEQVIDWLEHSAENFNQIDPDDSAEQNLLAGIEPFNYDVIDGIEYQIDVTRPVGERIVNATFEGEPLTADMEFAVVTNDYRATGGGNFPHLDGTNTIIETDEANRAALVRYVTETSPVTEPADRNWSVLPVEVDGTVTFQSSPLAEQFIDDYDVAGVTYLEERDGWGVFEYGFSDFTDQVEAAGRR
jgi:2',3'-cyclic-nucleotide 2'-phosphodiesterase